MDKIEAKGATSLDLMTIGMFLVFLNLKLSGAIDWSWWLVTAPLWVTAAVIIIFALVIMLGVSLTGKL